MLYMKNFVFIYIADNQLAYEKALGTSGKYQRGNAKLDLNLSIIDTIPVYATTKKSVWMPFIVFLLIVIVCTVKALFWFLK